MRRTEAVGSAVYQRPHLYLTQPPLTPFPTFPVEGEGAQASPPESSSPLAGEDRGGGGSPVFQGSLSTVPHKVLRLVSRIRPAGAKGRRPYSTRPAFASMARSRTLPPAWIHSGLASSTSLWLMPSMQGMKIMEVGATREM